MTANNKMQIKNKRLPPLKSIWKRLLCFVTDLQTAVYFHRNSYWKPSKWIFFIHKIEARNVLAIRPVRRFVNAFFQSCSLEPLSNYNFSHFVNGTLKPFLWIKSCKCLWSRVVNRCVLSVLLICLSVSFAIHKQRCMLTRALIHNSTYAWTQNNNNKWWPFSTSKPKPSASNRKIIDWTE